MVKRKTKPTEDGHTFDSTEELQFYWWCVEALKCGVIKDCKVHPEPYELSPSVLSDWNELGNTRAKPKVALRPCTYAPDFIITASERFEPPRRCIKFFRYKGPLLIDIKPSFERNHARSAKFSALQKWLWQKHCLFTHPVVIEDWFRETWMPDRAWFTATGRLKAGKSVDGMRTRRQFLQEWNSEQ